MCSWSCGIDTYCKGILGKLWFEQNQLYCFCCHVALRTVHVQQHKQEMTVWGLTVFLRLCWRILFLLSRTDFIQILVSVWSPLSGFSSVKLAPRGSERRLFVARRRQRKCVRLKQRQFLFVRAERHGFSRQTETSGCLTHVTFNSLISSDGWRTKRKKLKVKL